MDRRQLIIGLLLVLSACSASPSSTPVQSAEAALTYPERVELVVACVNEHGFEASSAGGFGVSVKAAGDTQLDAAGVIEGECWEEVDARYPPPPPLSLEEQYYYMLDVAECLRGMGYDVPHAPTVDAYIDAMSADTPPVRFWDPYFTLSRQGVDIYKLQREDCPPYPWAR